MEKIDLRKEWKHLYAPSAKQAELVKVPKFNFVMIDGQIEPGATPGTSQDIRASDGGDVRHFLHAQVHVQAAQDQPD